jgi:hypothetical protein
MGFFHLLSMMFDQSKRIKMLEEEICYLHRDMANLIGIVEALKQPEIHTHYIMITENVTCTDCDLNNTNDLDKLT